MACSSETAPPVAGVSLLPTGLGVVSFGEPADTALPLLRCTLDGPPSDPATSVMSIGAGAQSIC